MLDYVRGLLNKRLRRTTFALIWAAIWAGYGLYFGALDRLNLGKVMAVGEGNMFEIWWARIHAASDMVGIQQILMAHPVTLADLGPTLMAAIGTVIFVFYGVVANVRRLHDMGRSGFWTLLAVIPGINVLFALVLLVWPPLRGETVYGPDPRPKRFPVPEIVEDETPPTSQKPSGAATV